MLDEKRDGGEHKLGRTLLVLVMVVKCARDAENSRPPCPWRSRIHCLGRFDRAP